MRRDVLYLTDIIESADHIAGFIAGMGFEGFEKSELVRSAVVQKLSIIGEAAASFGGTQKPRSEGALAADRGFPQYSGPRIFRN